MIVSMERAPTPQEVMRFVQFMPVRIKEEAAVTKGEYGLDPNRDYVVYAIIPTTHDDGSLYDRLLLSVPIQNPTLIQQLSDPLLSPAQIQQLLVDSGYACAYVDARDAYPDKQREH